MTTDAKTIVCSYEAGLHLVGADEDGEMEFVGTPQQFRRYGELVKWVEDTGVFPWVKGVEVYPF